MQFFHNWMCGLLITGTFDSTPRWVECRLCGRGRFSKQSSFTSTRIQTHSVPFDCTAKGASNPPLALCPATCGLPQPTQTTQQVGLVILHGNFRFLQHASNHTIQLKCRRVFPDALVNLCARSKLLHSTLKPQCGSSHAKNPTMDVSIDLQALWIDFLHGDSLFVHQRRLILQNQKQWSYGTTVVYLQILEDRMIYTVAFSLYPPRLWNENIDRTRKISG